MVLGMALRRGQKGIIRVPCELVIDECHNFVGRDLETLLSEARKFGTHTILAQQVVGQGMSS